MVQTKRIVASAALIAMAVQSPGPVAFASCPFCSAVSQTLRQEMAAMDTVAIARIVPGSETDSDAKFSVSSVIRGDKLIRETQELTVNYFGKAAPDQNFLLMGVDPPELLWSSPLPVSDTAIDYIEAINRLPNETLPRLKFYIDYLEHPESLLARDAYDEFASAPYSDIQALKDKLDRERLIEWIKDTSLPADRKRLYFVMLGACGQPSDAALLEDMLRSDDPNLRAGLDSMIACYVTLKGQSGLELIDKLFLANSDCPYADTYQAIMALRFHGTEGQVVPKERILESMRLILDRASLADLVIPDLARWQDWSQIDKLVELFKTADEQSSWVRVPVINYLRACPKPEAEERLAELKELDPAAYKRATSFFPQPKTTDDSASITPARVRSSLASDIVLPLDQPLASTLKLAGQNIRAGQADAGSSLGSPLPQVQPVLAAGLGANRLELASVILVAVVSLCLAMWVSLSGAGSRVLPARLAVATERVS